MILLEPELESWLQNAARHLENQQDKIYTFQNEQIYVEYRIQNELAYVLPWSSGRAFLIDQGQGLAVQSKAKYPDLLLCFSESECPYFLELKDLLTSRNISKICQALRADVELMITQASRERTIQRWSAVKDPWFVTFRHKMTKRKFMFGGIGIWEKGQFSAHEDFREAVHQWAWTFADKWELTLILGDHRI